MMRRRSSPPKRGQAAPRRGQDKEREIDSELRAARANRKASTTQKQQLRRLDWEDEPLDDAEDDAMFEEADSADDEGGDAGDASTSR
jgi:hypothetical protein